MINRIAHIGIAVKDLEERVAFYRDVLGLRLESREELPGRNLRIAVFNLNGVHIELLEPTSPESNIAVFIEKRGEGLHHIAFGDDDIKGTLAGLTEEGRRPPRPRAAPGRRRGEDRLHRSEEHFPGADGAVRRARDRRAAMSGLTPAHRPGAQLRRPFVYRPDLDQNGVALDGHPRLDPDRLHDRPAPRSGSRSPSSSPR